MIEICNSVNMEEKLVSIVIPAYKCEKTISKCLESIINQTYSLIEVIVVIDGYSPDLKEIVSSFSQIDTRVNIVELKENRGVSNARNVGIEAAIGEYLCFIDSDDWIDENYINYLFDAISETRSDVYITDAVIEYNHSTQKNGFFKEKKLVFDNDFSNLINNCLIENRVSNKERVIDVGVPWGKIYRRKLIVDKDIKFENGLSLIEDSIFNINVFNCASKVVYEKKYIYHYSKKKVSLSSVRYKADYEKQMIHVFNILNRFCIDGYIRDSRVIVAKKSNMIRDCIKLQIMPKEANLSRHEIRQELKRIYNKYGIRFFSLINNRYTPKKTKILFFLFYFRLYRIVEKLYKKGFF